MILHVEFHCHTIASADSLTSPARLLETCRRKGIDRVVITDHNTIQGALRAKELDPERVIIGEEIMTQTGEILAAFVREEIPPGLPARETIDRLRDQGAFISVSHPFDSMRSGSWLRHDLIDIANLVDAIEIFNARCMLPSYNSQAHAFAKEYKLPGTAGSDAHAPSELGMARMLLPPFDDSAGLRSALQKVEYRLRLSGPWVHFYSRYAYWRKRRTSRTPN
jgi:predicted metal-dependent phosphoesterase TrpH